VAEPESEEGAGDDTAAERSGPRVFVSYDRDDRPRVEMFIAGIERAGVDVWWDHEIRGGEDFTQRIERMLDEVGVVVVVWSRASVQSEWVKAEASRARSRKKRLVPVRLDLDPNDIPLPFNTLHTLSIDDEPAILRAITEGEVRPSESPAPPRTEPSPKRFRASHAIAIAAIVIAALSVAGYAWWTDEAELPQDVVDALEQTWKPYCIVERDRIVDCSFVWIEDCTADDRAREEPERYHCARRPETVHCERLANIDHEWNELRCWTNRDACEAEVAKCSKGELSAAAPRDPRREIDAGPPDAGARDAGRPRRRDAGARDAGPARDAGRRIIVGPRDIGDIRDIRDVAAPRCTIVGSALFPPPRYRVGCSSGCALRSPAGASGVVTANHPREVPRIAASAGYRCVPN
jgi:hypothetical protein